MVGLGTDLSPNKRPSHPVRIAFVTRIPCVYELPGTFNWEMLSNWPHYFGITIINQFIITNVPSGINKVFLILIISTSALRVKLYEVIVSI